MDYSVYKFTKKELGVQILLYTLLDGVVSYLFYRSFYAFILFSPGVLWFLKERRKTFKRKRTTEFLNQFLAGMKCISTALSAGYAIENAFEESLKEIGKIYGKGSMIFVEFSNIAAQIKLNRPVEQLVANLAERTDIEDIISFAQVFKVSKRTGGDMQAIIRNTVGAITQKQETQMEIGTCLASKKMEQNIMSAVPFFILIYVSVASPGFLDVLYHNEMGAVVMSICLAIYLAAWFLGRKIVNIEV